MNHVMNNDVALLSALFVENTQSEQDHFTRIHQADIFQSLANMENAVEQLGFVNQHWQKQAYDTVYELSRIIIEYMAGHPDTATSFQVGQLRSYAPTNFSNAMLTLNEYVLAVETKTYIEQHERELQEAAFDFTQHFARKEYQYVYILMTLISDALVVDVNPGYAYITQLFAQVSVELRLLSTHDEQISDFMKRYPVLTV